MDQNYYPPEIDTGLLLPIRCVFDGMLNDPLWLERRQCPYDTETVDALRDLWVTFRASKEIVVPTAVTSINDGENKWDNIETELTSLYDDLRNHSKTMTLDDAKEKMAYFRTATSLLDKITSIGERVQNVKAVSDFQARVMMIFDEVLTPEQRTTAMEKLAG